MIMGTIVSRKRNVAEQQVEMWRPPLHTGSKSRWQQLLNPVRRFFDLQMGSIYNDLAPALVEVSGVVLDVGCGGQPFRRLLPASAVYIGIDIRDAKKHFGYDVPDTVYYSGEIWPIRSSSVDIVLATETLGRILLPEGWRWPIVLEACTLQPPGFRRAAAPESDPVRWSARPESPRS
jgi:hypothetical protein